MSDNSSSNKRIAKNSIFLSMRMVVVLCITLYTSRVVLHTLGVEDYGIFNVVGGFVAMFTFLNTSMSNGIQRYFNYELSKNGEEGANRVYRTALLIQLILGIVIVVLTESIGIWYLHNKMVIPDGRMLAADWVFQIVVINFLLVIMQVPYTAAVMAHERMDFYAIVSIVDAVLKLLLVLLLPYVGYDKLIVWAIFGLFIHVIDFCLYFLYCKRNFNEIHLDRKSYKKVDKTLFGSMLGFSGWNIFGSFSNIMRDQGINLIINLFFGTVVNAARGIAVQVNAAISGLVSSILTPVRPQVIQSYAKGEIDRSMRLTFSISKISLCFLFFLALPVCVEIDFILKLWLGDVVPEHSQAFCIIILITSSILIPMGALATLVHASGKMSKYQLIGGSVKLLSVPIAYVLLKLGYAAEWAFIMVLLFDAIGLIVGMFIIKSLMPFSINAYFRFVVFPIIPVLVITFLADWFMHILLSNVIIRVGSVFFLGSLIMLTLVYFIAMTKEEKMLINGMVVKFFKRKRT